MSVDRFPLTISLKPWFQDHRFDGRAVLPAVETMLLLAAAVARRHPEVDIRSMENVSFASFLEIPPDTADLAGFVECHADSRGRVQVKLLSRIQFRKMSRIKEHGEIFFSAADSFDHPAPGVDPAPPTRPVTEVDVDHLYREMVPFGSNYRTLQETLYLSGDQAWGRLQAPQLPADPLQKILGSPFPLDGALHAACVLGLQVVDFVPFPVGFAKRVITRPTRPGGCYRTRVIAVSRTSDELVFDLIIFNDEGQVFETVTGLRMRDVSGARRK